MVAGIRAVEVANQCLAFLVARLFEAGVECPGPDVCRRNGRCGKATALAAFAYRKFAAEEAFMGQIGYPALPTHVEDHRRLRTHLDDIALLRDCGTAVTRLRAVVDGWLPHHLAAFDRSFSQWACGRTLAPSGEEPLAPLRPACP